MIPARSVCEFRHRCAPSWRRGLLTNVLPAFPDSVLLRCACRPPLYDEVAVKFNLRLPEPLYETLRAMAKRERLSVNQLIVRVLQAAKRITRSLQPKHDQRIQTDTHVLRVFSPACCAVSRVSVG